MKLPASYYQHPDVVFLAKDLIGKVLCTHISGKHTSGIITETEAYRGWGDQACHAHLNRRTKRTEIMYHPGGVAYVYLCYGIHNLFNIITNEKDAADAVLIRAIEPLEGIEIMLHRRQMDAVHPRLTSGPGNVSQALGIDRAYYGSSLTGPCIWIEERKSTGFTENIIASHRIGIDYAGEDAKLPWRFYAKKSRFVSRR